MNSTLKSVGKYFPLLAMTLIAGCKSSPTPETSAPSVQVREELKDDVSIKADRSPLDEIRKEIPEHKHQTNDELTLVLGLMGEVKLKPSEISARYQTASHKRRTEFRNKVANLRQSFKKEEAKRKADFFKEQKTARAGFDKKTDRQASREFYARLDSLRSEFFAQERDRRKDFESEITSQSADFDSYMREKQKEFSEQQRLYSRRFYEVEKENREAAKTDKSKIPHGNNLIKPKPMMPSAPSVSEPAVPEATTAR